MGESIKSQLQKITNLPTLPAIAREILDLTNDPLLSINKFKDVVGRDPAICAKILSIANSSFFGALGRTIRLDDAILRIGFNNVKDIAIGASIMAILADTYKTSSYKRLVDHSMSVGLTARTIARKLKMNIAEDIMIEGLLHDLGFLVLNKYFPGIYKQLLDKLNHGGSILDAEREIIHYTHAEIGFWLAEQWNLPDTILDTILYHHAPSLAGRNEKHAAIVHIADHIASRYNFGPFERDPGYQFDQSSFAILSITDNDLKSMEETISCAFNSKRDVNNKGKKSR